MEDKINDKNTHISTDAILEPIRPLMDKANAYYKWLTNVSLVIFGFFITVLLQIRSDNQLKDSIFPIVILLVNLIPIGIGIVLRTKDELIEYYERGRLFLKNLILIYESHKQENGDIDLSDDSKVIITKFIHADFKFSTFEQIKNTLSVGLIMFQGICLILTLILIIIYVIIYLFC